MVLTQSRRSSGASIEIGLHDLQFWHFADKARYPTRVFGLAPTKHRLDSPEEPIYHPRTSIPLDAQVGLGRKL
jgi:hypothetical protein